MKITPLYDKSWYIKWAGSLTLIAAIICRAAGYTDWDIILSLIGTLGWLVTGFLWQDRSLIALNGVAFVILTLGIVAWDNG